MGLQGGTNTYAYVSSNPNSFFDLLGLTQQDIEEMVCLARKNNPDLDIPDPKIRPIRSYGNRIVAGYVGPWPWSKPVINKLFLGKLDADMRVILYNTIIHESWHYDKQPF